MSTLAVDLFYTSLLAIFVLEVGLVLGMNWWYKMTMPFSGKQYLCFSIQAILSLFLVAIV